MKQIVWKQYGEEHTIDVDVWVREDEWAIYVISDNYECGMTIPVPKYKIVSIDGISFEEWKKRRNNNDKTNTS
jgi:hypothetical protein